MEKLKKIIGIKIPEKWMAVLAIIGMLGLLAPIFRLALYAVPYYDDYLHVKFARSFLREYGGFSGWLEGVLYTVKSQYYAWQGTFSTQFIVSASPIILDHKYYGYAVIAVLAIFVISVMAFVLWGKPQISKKINDWIPTLETKYQKLSEALITIVNMIVFACFSLSTIGFILFTMLALGL